METKKQKQALRKLLAVSKDLDMEDFYRISLTSWGEVCFQGHFNSKILIWGKKHRFSFDVNETLGYIQMKKHNVEIVLT